MLKKLFLTNLQNDEFDKFKHLTSEVLDFRVPLQEKHIRYNQAPFMGNNFHKAIMTRSRVLNQLRKTKPMKTNALTKKQRNYCVILLERSKKSCYDNFNVSTITDNKTFCKTKKPSFTEKSVKDQKIQKYLNLLKYFWSYFENIVKNLYIERPNLSQSDSNPVSNIKILNNIRVHRFFFI